MGAIVAAAADDVGMLSIPLTSGRNIIFINLKFFQIVTNVAAAKILQRLKSYSKLV